MSVPDSFTRTADKAGVIGAIVTAMGCVACFPALASVGAAIGLGFLGQYEGVFIRYLLPLFAIIALLANVFGGLRHRQWPRMAVGMVGPVLVLAAALLMATMGWPTAWLLYPGLVLMVAISVWEIVSPPVKAFTEQTGIPRVAESPLRTGALRTTRDTRLTLRGHNER